MAFYLIGDDITALDTDVIVNAADPLPEAKGGVDAAIHRAAGPELMEARKKIGKIATGDVAATPAFRLPSKYVFHAVGPVWFGGHRGEEEALRSCYRKSLAMAEEIGAKSIAFPMISAGVFGYPYDEAQRIATEECTGFLKTHEMEVYLIKFREPTEEERRKRYGLLEDLLRHNVLGEESYRIVRDSAMLWDDLKEPFSPFLFSLIKKKNMDEVEVYKRANLDRKHFSKIRNNRDYQPKKSTVLALALALRLNLEETEELLERAGFAFSPGKKEDMIVKYYISRGVYDIFTVNDALFTYTKTALP